MQQPGGGSSQANRNPSTTYSTANFPRAPFNAPLPSYPPPLPPLQPPPYTPYYPSPSTNLVSTSSKRPYSDPDVPNLPYQDSRIENQVRRYEQSWGRVPFAHRDQQSSQSGPTSWSQGSSSDLNMVRLAVLPNSQTSDHRLIPRTSYPGSNPFPNRYETLSFVPPAPPPAPKSKKQKKAPKIPTPEEIEAEAERKAAATAKAQENRKRKRKENARVKNQAAARDRRIAQAREEQNKLLALKGEIAASTFVLPSASVESDLPANLDSDEEEDDEEEEEEEEGELKQPSASVKGKYANKPLRDFLDKPSQPFQGVNPYKNSLVVRGPIGEIVSIRKLDEEGDPAPCSEEGERYLSHQEKKSISTLARKLWKKSEHKRKEKIRKEKRQLEKERREGPLDPESDLSHLAKDKLKSVKEINPSPVSPPDRFLNLEEYVKPHFLTLVEYRRERNDEMRKNRQEKERASRDEMNVEEGEVVEGEINRSAKSQEPPSPTKYEENSSTKKTPTTTESIEQSHDTQIGSPQPTSALTTLAQPPSAAPFHQAQAPPSIAHEQDSSNQQPPIPTSPTDQPTVMQIDSAPPTSAPLPSNDPSLPSQTRATADQTFPSASVDPPTDITQPTHDQAGQSTNAANDQPRQSFPTRSVSPTKAQPSDPLSTQASPSKTFRDVVGIPSEAEDSEMAEVKGEENQKNDEIAQETRNQLVPLEQAEQEIPPSSDLSDFDQEAVASGDEEDSGNESISEVLAKRVAGRASSVTSQRLSNKNKTLPVYLDELVLDEDEYVPWWGDPSVSAFVKSFIEQRDEILSLQKSFQTRSSAKQERDALGIVTTRRTPLNDVKQKKHLEELSTYIAFCRILKIHPFPISDALIALYIYQYRAQWPEESRLKTAQSLRMFSRWTSPLYGIDNPTLVRLNSWFGAQEVIKELERPISKAVKSRSEPSTTTAQASHISPAPTLETTPVQPRDSAPSHSATPFPLIEKSEKTPTPALPPPSATGKAGRPRLALPKEKTGELSRAPSVDDSSSVASSPKPTGRKVRRNIPLPNVGDRFESLRAVKMSAAAAVIYSQGYTTGANPNGPQTTLKIYCRGPGEDPSKGCSFRIHASLADKEDLWKIDSRMAKHTHKPATFLNDPEWRPTTIDRDIRETMRQIDENNQLDQDLRKVTKEKRALRRSNADEPPTKRSRTASPARSVSTIQSVMDVDESREPSTRANSPSPPLDPKLDRAASNHSSEPSVEPSTKHLSDPSTHSTHEETRTGEGSVATSTEVNSQETKPVLPPSPRCAPAPSLPSAAIQASVASSLPRPSSDETASSFYSVPKIPSASRRLDLTLPPVPQLVHFLRALDASLTTLAPLLQASGYTNLNTLVEFAVLSPFVRKMVYKRITAQTDVVIDPRLFALLEQKLVEASESSWA